MVDAVKSELKRLHSTPTIVFFAVFLVYPTVAGILVLPAYTYRAPVDSFTLMTGSAVTLVFPLLLTALYVFRFSGLLQNRYAFYARFRSGTDTFLGTHLVVNIVVVGVLVFLSYVIAGVVAFLILPGTAALFRMDSYRPMSANRVGEYTAHVQTFTQLAELGTWVYVVGFAMFVAVFSMVIATASLGFTLISRSRILGLSATLVLYTVESFVLSYAGLQRFRTDISIFPNGMVQQPLWVPMIPLLAWMGLAASLTWWMRRSSDRLDTLA